MLSCRSHMHVLLPTLCVWFNEFFFLLSIVIKHFFLIFIYLLFKQHTDIRNETKRKNRTATSIKCIANDGQDYSLSLLSGRLIYFSKAGEKKISFGKLLSKNKSKLFGSIKEPKLIVDCQRRISGSEKNCVKSIPLENGACFVGNSFSPKNEWRKTTTTTTTDTGHKNYSSLWSIDWFIRNGTITTIALASKSPRHLEETHTQPTNEIY